jgi:hypothetical protein
MTQTTNAATELNREHDEIDRLAVRMATLGPGCERAALMHEVCARFLDHIRIEERFLYPALRGLLRDGRTLAQVQTDRNRALVRTIEAVERGEAEGDELDILVGHVLIGLEDHVDLQDTVLLPELLGACSNAEIAELGEQLHDGIRFAREAAERPAGRAAVGARGQADHADEADQVNQAADQAAVRPERRRRGLGGLFRRRQRAHQPADAG